jgi:tetratricopeptide (TPR) repeat protein
VSRTYGVAHLDDITAGPGADGSTWIQVRRHFGIEAFGVNAYRADAGTRVIEDHNETGSNAGGHEELYVVASGRARFTLDGEELDAAAGTLVFVGDPETQRGAVAEEDGTTVFVVSGKPGQPFDVSPWEAAADAWSAYEAKDYETAIAVFNRVLEKHPGAAGTLYNLACCESLVGRGDDAIEHLGRAIEIDERFRELARTDSDFDPIRDDPRVRELVPA